MGIEVRKIPHSGNRYSLILDIYHQGTRIRETLRLYPYRRPKNEVEKTYNRQAWDQAAQIRSKREIELSASDYHVQPAFKKRIDILAYFDNYAQTYTKKNARSTQASVAHFKKFLGKSTLPAKQLTEEVCTAFKDYLSHHLKGETPYDYFTHFKRMLKKAVRDGIYAQSPAAHVVNRKIEGPLKDILTIEELQTLAATACGSKEVRRAFLFACNTGLRACDVRMITWASIQSGVLKFVQSKTQQPVSINLNATARELLGIAALPEQPIFKLPSQNGVNKTLDAWAKRAKLTKHLTFHCARHTFATLALLYGGSVVSVSSLLGHTSLKHTQRYVRAVEEMKEQAVNNIPKLAL